MPSNTNPIFISSHEIGNGQVSVANPNLDGTGALVTIFDGSNFNGFLIDYIHIQAIVATTAGMVRLFLDDGVNVRLWKEIAVSAITPTATVKAFEIDVFPVASDTSIPLGSAGGPSAYIVKASTEKAETFNITAHGGQY